MNIKEFFQSKKIKIITLVIGTLIIALLIFQAGIFIGYKKAAFSFGWGDNYYQTFGNPDRRSFMGMPRENFPSAHGATGQIIKISPPTLIIKGPDNIEKIILINDKTSILRFQETIKFSDLKVDDLIVVIGTPNKDSQIEAKLIRIMPAPIQPSMNKAPFRTSMF